MDNNQVPIFIGQCHIIFIKGFNMHCCRGLKMKHISFQVMTLDGLVVVHINPSKGGLRK
jgi:hypothetical protein